MAKLAFYKGQRTFVDKVICAVTRSPYSHVEMLIGDPKGSPTLSISSSGRDGGVRERWIEFDPNRWDIVDVPWSPQNALELMRAELSKPYDFVGLLGSQVFNLRRQQSGRWFCSEICAYALGLGAPHRYAPGDLKRQIEERNALHFGKFEHGHRE